MCWFLTTTGTLRNTTGEEFEFKKEVNSELGTLGCLATTAPTPQNPKGKVVAITNRSILYLPRQNISLIS